MILTIQEVQKYGSDMLHQVADICEKHNIRWYMAYGSLLGAIRHHGPIPWDYDIDIYVPECDLDNFLVAMKENLPPKYWVDYRDDPKCPRSFPRIGLAGYETEKLHVDVFRLAGVPTNHHHFMLFARYTRALFVIWKAKTADIEFLYAKSKKYRKVRVLKAITRIIPIDLLIKLLDRQAKKIPFDCAEKVASIAPLSLKKIYNKCIFDESMLVDYLDFKVRVPKRYEEYLITKYGDWKTLPPEEIRNKVDYARYDIRSLTK